jgi:Electron transfer DM13
MRMSNRLLILPMLLLACNNAEPPTAPDAMAIDPGMAAPMGNATTGTFRRTRYDVTGTVQFVVENGVGQLTFSPNFSIAQTPGPTVYLGTTNNPNSGTPLRIGALKARNGAQSYTFQLPAGVRYSWVIIWCDPFNVPMAEAAITPTP